MGRSMRDPESAPDPAFRTRHAHSIHAHKAVANGALMQGTRMRRLSGGSGPSLGAQARAA